MQLRDYQQQTVSDIHAAWGAGHRNVLAVLPTGAGKTVIFGHVLAQHAGKSVVIAHRQELVAQISMSLARFGVPHRITAAPALIKYVTRQHVRLFGRPYYNPQADCMLASVKSLIIQADRLPKFLSGVRLWVLDEAHHQLSPDRNQWGKAVELLPPGCKGLGVTATPERADGKGLGRGACGLIDHMVVGPGMGELIRRGYLSSYKIFAPPTHGLDLSNVPVGSGGDFVKKKLITAVQKSQITGDVVGSYLTHTPGKLGVTFVPDVKTGDEMAARFNAAGVPCQMVHAKTPDKERNGATEALGRGDLKQLVNVDIFGEGFDLPAIEVVSFARPTQSFPVYSQQFGRALRTMDGKPHAVILDHVGNVMRHGGPPDVPRKWSLENREKRGGKAPEGPPVRVCTQCTAVYMAYVRDCPYCGYKYQVEASRDIEQVEGDLTEMDPEVLAALRGEINRIDAPEDTVRRQVSMGAGALAGAGAAKRHRERQEAQGDLRCMISLWAGAHKAQGREDSEIYRRFYLGFGVDILAAQTLGRPEAERLTARIRETF